MSEKAALIPASSRSALLVKARFKKSRESYRTEARQAPGNVIASALLRG